MRMFEADLKEMRKVRRQRARLSVSEVTHS